MLLKTVPMGDNRLQLGSVGGAQFRSGFFSRIPQTRMIESAGESSKDSKCQIWPTSYRGWPPRARVAADRTSVTLLARRWRLTFVPH
jgi:hypothetical protein